MSVTTTPHVNFRGRPAKRSSSAGRSAVQGYDPGEDPFYITLQGTAGDEIQPLWDALADSATTILIPLAPAPFAPLYGMLTDRYGVTWIVGADTAPQTD